MHHAHTWHMTSYVLLEIPDAAGYANRFLAWRCPCGQYCWISGHIRLGEPLRTPTFWHRLVATLDDELHAQVVTRQGQGRRG